MPRAKTKMETKTPGSFGYQLMKYRKLKELTQADLAREVGVSQRVISYYENESSHPPSTILIKLTEILGVSSDILLGVLDSRKEIISHDSLLAKKFLNAEKLPTSDKKAIIQVIDAMISKNNIS